MRQLTQKEKENVILDGYIIIRSAVPEPLLRAAVQAADAAYRPDKSSPHSVDAPTPPLRYVAAQPVITDLFSRTCLSKLSQQLLPEDSVTLRHPHAQIAYTLPKSDGLHADTLTELAKPHDPTEWHVDSTRGRFAALAADFLLLVGIALSDGQDVDENRGQLTVFPGMFCSH